MTSPFQNHQSSHPLDPNQWPHVTHAGEAAASPAARTGGSNSSRTGPTSFSNILNPLEGDWSSTVSPDPARGHQTPLNMTQNGSDLDEATGGVFMPTPTPTQQLPESSRAFEMFMTRATLDSLAGIDPVTAGRIDSVTNPARTGSTANTSVNFPRPSYLQGSHYLARLEQQTQQLASTQRESNGVQVANGHSASLQGNKSQAPESYLGVARDVVERPPVVDNEDTVDPLPTRWGPAKEDKSPGLDIMSDGLEVKYTAQRNPNDREHEACSVRADHPMPLQCGLYYFEVTILSRKQNDTTIAIGFSGKSVSLNRAPGWEPESWGYHGDDGHCFASQNVGRNYGPTFTAGDTIGCGVNFVTGEAFFTKNGKNLKTAFKDVKGKLYPSVGLKKTGEHIRVNFGQTPFEFDIDTLMKNEIRRLEQEILQADTSKLSPPLTETELIQQLVLQFLQHDGYVETARAFAREIQTEKQSLCLNPNEEIPGIDIKDDEDANNRQRIRRSILEGDIDKALKHTNAFYPQVLKENEQVYFRLRCRKFIEMIRREAETNFVGGDKRSHGMGNNGHGHPPQGEDMELDDDMEDVNGSTDMTGSRDLTQVALLYGQSLQAEYAGDERRDVRATLEEIFSLMAYQNPLKEAKVAHLLDRKGRVAVAEELNSAILQSLGKSSRAALENVYAQTSVLLDDLAETGGPGAFVTLKSIIDEVELNKQPEF